MKIISTIEDCLDILVSNSNFLLEEGDKSILSSINRQLKRAVPLTDRQHDLVKEKLLKYHDQFMKNDYVNFEGSINQLKYPLRMIDRSKTIKTVTNVKHEAFDFRRDPTLDENTKWLEVKFPFNKKIISSIGELAKQSKGTYYHKNGSKEHYFLFTEKNVFRLVSEFKDRNFIIDQDILEYYEKCKNIIDNKHQYIPMITESGLINVHEKTQELLQKDIGPFSKNNISLYYDRKLRYGIQSEKLHTGDKLTDSIVNRQDMNIQFKPSEIEFERIASVLNSLKRFPLIVELDEKQSHEQLMMTHQAFSKHVDNSEQVVLFRNENKGNIIDPLNQYIHDNKLNNKIDKNLKIVYIKRGNLPKPLFESEWKPICSLNFKSSFSSNNNADKYTSYFCDLKIYYEEFESPFYKFSK